MDWTHLITTLWGASFAGLLAWGLYRVSFERAVSANKLLKEQLRPDTDTLQAALGLFHSRRRLEDDEEEEIVEKDERDQIDRAFDALDEQERMPGLHNNVFPLAPRAQDREPEKRRLVEPTHPKAEDLIIKPSPGHPCRFLDSTTPPHFREGDCSGVCRYPRQNGRACFWAPNVAKECTYFDPKVKPRLRLRTTGS